jgi:hypothetical protein
LGPTAAIRRSHFARKNYPLRLDPAVHAAIERWAADDLRSVNAQIEFLLRDALRRSGRLSANPSNETDEENSREAGR